MHTEIRRLLTIWREESALSYAAAKSERKDSRHWWILMTDGDAAATKANQLEAALLAASPAPADESWQPITAAPKDGTPVRLRWEGTSVEATGRWVQGNNLRYATSEWRDVLGDDLLVSPTHCRTTALAPAPPEEESNE